MDYPSFNVKVLKTDGTVLMTEIWLNQDRCLSKYRSNCKIWTSFLRSWSDGQRVLVTTCSIHTQKVSGEGTKSIPYSWIFSYGDIKGRGATSIFAVKSLNTVFSQKKPHLIKILTEIFIFYLTKIIYCNYNISTGISIFGYPYLGYKK